jgi:hypothetical protein
MTVYFSNKGVIDLDVIRTMGVNVKENDNPIGHFGTGLKFAIATLLRTGHTVDLYRAGEKIHFDCAAKVIRNKPFAIVTMNEEQLAFTNDLGKGWEVWQAYRELHSNCLDEMGKITNRPVEDMDTVWAISGEQIEDCFNTRSQIFLTGEPSWMAGDGVEVYRGESKYLYYRGVRVHELPKKSAFTYNFLMPMMLTEDRTLSSVYDANYKLATRLPKIDDPSYCERILHPRFDGYESDLDLGDCYEPSESFLNALERMADDISDKRRDILKKHRKQATVRKAIELTPAQKEIVESAKIYLETLRVFIEDDEVVFVESLGQGIEGMMEDGVIYIPATCIAKGIQWVASTIYEEWIHKHRGFPDRSRGMQQYLFDKIFELVQEKVTAADPMKKLGLKG